MRWEHSALDRRTVKRISVGQTDRGLVVFPLFTPLTLGKFLGLSLFPGP